jgi:hypothetical protein
MESTMSKTRTPDPDQDLDNRQDTAIYRLRLLTRLAKEVVSHSMPDEVSLELGWRF